MAQVKVGYAQMVEIAANLSAAFERIEEALPPFLAAITNYSSSIQDDIASEANELAANVQQAVAGARNVLNEMNAKLSVAASTFTNTENTNRDKIKQIKKN